MIDPYLTRHDIARILAAPVAAMWADLTPEGRWAVERVVAAQLMAFGALPEKSPNSVNK